jgi:hypothetical protein
MQTVNYDADKGVEDDADKGVEDNSRAVLDMHRQKNQPIKPPNPHTLLCRR